jgi:hypothetical protein
MCEQCRYAHIEVVRGMISTARRDQILRLLRDIRRSGDAPDGGAA